MCAGRKRGTILDTETREDLSDKPGGKRTITVYMWGKSGPRRQNSTCKGPEARLHLEGSRNSEEAHMAGVE